MLANSFNFGNFHPLMLLKSCRFLACAESWFTQPTGDHGSTSESSAAAEIVAVDWNDSGDRYEPSIGRHERRLEAKDVHESSSKSNLLEAMPRGDEHVRDRTPQQMHAG